MDVEESVTINENKRVNEQVQILNNPDEDTYNKIDSINKIKKMRELLKSEEDKLLKNEKLNKNKNTDFTFFILHLAEIVMLGILIIMMAKII